MALLSHVKESTSVKCPELLSAATQISSSIQYRGQSRCLTHICSAGVSRPTPMLMAWDAPTGLNGKNLCCLDWSHLLLHAHASNLGSPRNAPAWLTPQRLYSPRKSVARKCIHLAAWRARKRRPAMLTWWLSVSQWLLPGKPLTFTDTNFAVAWFLAGSSSNDLCIAALGLYFQHMSYNTLDWLTDTLTFCLLQKRIETIFGFQWRWWGGC